MKRSDLHDLVCPYCGGTFTITAEVEATAERVNWGLIECRCFEFPIIDGVLLLSLSKGAGGPEDELFPYAPLQVASIEFLKKNDVAGLRAWITKHIPSVAPLLTGGAQETYLGVSARLGVDIAPLVTDYLDEMSKFGVVGLAKPKERLRSKLRPSPALTADRNVELSRLVDYYTTRFFSPRANALAMRMSHLSFEGRILSLCCGHGVFENFVRALGYTPDLVCIDAQLVNLLITRTFANSDASFILHDVQFALPFRDGTFDGVFSSTCMPEIPAQKHFVEQKIRVTAPTGWTFFDRTWNLELGMRRIDNTRHYRFAQNYFSSFEGYVEMFRECAGPSRDVGIDLPQPTAAYVKKNGWAFGTRAINARLKDRKKFELSALVVDPSAFKGFVTPDRSAAMVPSALSVSPVFDATLKRRPQLAHLDTEQSDTFVPFPEQLALDRDRLADEVYLLEQFCLGNVALLPERFDSDTKRLSP